MTSLLEPFAVSGEVIELDYERCLVIVRLDSDIPPFMEVKQRFALEHEAAAGVIETSDEAQRKGNGHE